MGRQEETVMGAQVGSRVKLGAWNDRRKSGNFKGCLHYSGFGAEAVILNIRWRVKLGVGSNEERETMTAKRNFSCWHSSILLDPEGGSTRDLFLECLAGKATEGGNGRNPRILSM